MGVGQLAREAEGHQRRRMGVDDGAQVGAHAVNLLVEGQLHGRLVNADEGAVGLDLNDVAAGQAALVDARGGNPDVAVVVSDGQIAAGGGGHAVAVNTRHNHHQLIGGMHQIKTHVNRSFHSVRIHYDE